MARDRIKKPIVTPGQKIKLSNQDTVHYNDLPPAFLFSYAQDNYCLSSWNSRDIKKLIKKLSRLEDKKWTEILNQRIYQFSKVNKMSLTVPIPTKITEDTTIYYFKPFGQDTSHRVFGMKERHNFQFIWFDKNHEVYP